MRSPRRSVIAPMCCWCSASSPADFNSPSSPMHLPAYLVDRGLPVQTGGWVIATIGLFNIIGSLSVGWLQSRYPKRYILSAIYFVRARCRSWRSSRCRSPHSSALAFGISTGLTWLSTVPPTSSLVALMFGTRWLATLYGFCLFQPPGRRLPRRAARRHRVRKVRAPTRRSGGCRYFSACWSALINLPIVEAPVARPVAQLRPDPVTIAILEKVRGVGVGNLQGDQDRQGGKRHHRRADPVR